MADGEASIYGGYDPTDPEQLAAQQAQARYNIAINPQNWQGYGTGAFTGLAHMLAMAQNPGGQAQDIVSNIAAQRSAAYPELARALAAPDPATYAANNPMSPLAQSMLLTQLSPTTEANIRNVGSEVGLRGQQTIGQQLLNLQRLRYLNDPSSAFDTPATSAPATATAPAPSTVTRGTPGWSSTSRLPPASSSFTGGRYGGGPGSAGGDTSFMSTMPKDPTQRQAWYNGLTPAQRSTFGEILRGGQ